jgi:uncharacterized protein (UPF0332 family)
MSDKNAELISLHMKAADEALAAGQYTFEGGFSDVAVTRAYYACFYAASALLLTRDITRSKHSGVLSAFRQHFIKSGIIESEYSDIYGEAFDARHIADYDVIGALDPQEAHKTLTNARRFVARIETYLSKVGYK